MGLALVFVLLAGCLDFEVDVFPDPPIDDTPQTSVALDDIDPALRLDVDFPARTVRLSITSIDCVQLDPFVHIELDGEQGDLVRGRLYANGLCEVPGATFDLPSDNGVSSFVVSDGTTTWTVDAALFAYSFSFESRSEYRAGDTVSIALPSLDATQIPTIRVHSATLDLTIPKYAILRANRSAYFEMPPSGINEEHVATMTVSGQLTPNVVRCTAPRGCIATPYIHEASTTITLLP